MLWVRVKTYEAEEMPPEYDRLVPLSKVCEVYNAFNPHRDDVVDMGRYGGAPEVRGGSIADSLYRISPSGIHKVNL